MSRFTTAAIIIVVALIWIFPEVALPVALVVYSLVSAAPPRTRGTRWYGYRDANGRGFLE